MKKFILGLGTLASTVAPIAAVVACGTNADGSITLNKEETQMALSMVKDVLGLDSSFINAAVKDEFELTVNSVSEVGVDLSLTRSHKGTAVTSGTIPFTKLVIGTASAQLDMATGETLHVQLTLNAGKDAIATTMMSLSGSKTADKNTVVKFKATNAPTATVLKDLFKKLNDAIKGETKTVKLTDTHLGAIESALGTNATSAESIFGGKDAALASIDATKSSLAMTMKFDKFDATLTLVTKATAVLRVFGTVGSTDAHADANAGKTTTVHLMGTLDMSNGHVTNLTMKEANVDGTTITLNETGTKTLVTALVGIVNPHGSGH